MNEHDRQALLLYRELFAAEEQAREYLCAFDPDKLIAQQQVVKELRAKIRVHEGL